MKNYILLFWALFLLTQAHAQSLETTNIGSAGTYVSGSSGGLQYNIGETIVLQSNALKAGVIQYVKISTLVNSDFDPSDVKIFPNPTSGPLNITSRGQEISQWFLADQQGKVLLTVGDQDEVTTMNVSSYPAGQYYLIPVSSGKPQAALPLQIIH